MDEGTIVWVPVRSGAIIPMPVSVLNDMPPPNWWTETPEEIKEYLATEWWK